VFTHKSSWSCLNHLVLTCVKACNVARDHIRLRVTWCLLVLQMQYSFPEDCVMDYTNEISQRKKFSESEYFGLFKQIISSKHVIL
jgi:hypothetical protein